MTLTPLDIENTKFRGALGGYNRAEVDLLLSRVSQELETRLRQIEELQRRISQLEQTVATYRESEELLKNSVVLAQRTSDEIIAAAHQQADAIRREAEQAGRDTARRMGELQAEREQFEYAFHGLLAGFLTRLEQGNPALGRPSRAPELEARTEQAADAGPLDPDSHSRQLLTEAGSPETIPPVHDDAQRVPGIPVPEIRGPGQPRDDFEQAIAEARPAPRETWPAAGTPPDPEETDDAGADDADADAFAPGGEGETDGAWEEPELEEEAEPGSGDDADEPGDGRLPLD